MAEIKPFKAWRYNGEAGKNIESLVSPLFDVVTPERLQELYKNPFNSIHLSVPQGGASHAARVLEDWKNNGTLIQDEIPAIYIYYQFYTDPVDYTSKCRKGFVCNIRVHEWADKIILHHENTIPGSVSDRLSILTETGFHASATHGLYSDPEQTLDKYMDEAIGEPLYVNNSDGITDVISRIHDFEVIHKFISLLADKQVILADGHHRYEASIQHLRNRKANGDMTPEYHLMYLSNADAGGLTVLPTHRIISGISNFDREEFIKKLNDDFSVESIDSSSSENLIPGEPESFVVLTGEYSFRVRLRSNKSQSNPWPFPKNILKLDLTILHYFIIEKILNIPGSEQRKSGNVSFERDIQIIQNLVRSGKVQAAVLTNPVTIDQIMSVCSSGYTLPQKSTWFYPKLNSGYFFSSILPGEAHLPHYVKF